MYRLGNIHRGRQISSAKGDPACLFGWALMSTYLPNSLFNPITSITVQLRTMGFVQKVTYTANDLRTDS